MPKQNNIYQNYIILLTGLPGVGKRTVAEVIAKHTNIRFSDHHDLTDPILKLFGDDYQIFWDLTPDMWGKLNAVIDVYLSAIADVCSRNDSFILTEMMFDQQPYHKIFYDKVLEVVKKRGATFIPIRLLCDEEELAKRVQSEDRKKYFKTRDPELSRKRSKEITVFYSHHPNEVTINNTNKSPEEVCNSILEAINNINKKHQ